MKHVFQKAALSAAVLATLGAVTTANAAVVDQPSFKVLPVVVVWGGDGAGNAQVADFLVGSGTNDLITADVTPVMTGSLSAFAPTADGEVSVTENGDLLAYTDVNNSGVLDAGDSMTAFAPTATISAGGSVLESSFYVASNTGFSINAAVTNPSGDLSKVTHSIDVTQSGEDDGQTFGSAAKPTSELGLTNYGGSTLDALSGTVLTVANATADAAGTIAEQSIRIDNTYALDTSAGGLEKDPSTDIVADVTYTIAIP
ncbi:hypothetical protein Q4485_05295 [Granulosicoccaceae sp. 1_MG-2023]|nr:hypothetical protein [Granulosicoccaceae sp. 1_MG-2023]